MSGERFQDAMGGAAVLVGLGNVMGFIPLETYALLMVVGWWAVATRPAWWPSRVAEQARERETL